MAKLTNFSIVASFLGLWINSFLDENFQLIIGFILIFSFGILHGANDLLLINRSKSKNNSITFYKILSYYIIVVLLGALLFYFIPIVALLLFILVSGYHFGEQHWQIELSDGSKPINLLFHLFYGLLLLSMLFIFHVNEVQRIISAISNITIPSEFITSFFYVSLGCFLTLGVVKFISLKKLQKLMLQELLFLLVFAIIFKTSSLIWGFTLYFIFWHSIPSMKDQIDFLYGSFSFENFKAYLKSAFVYWIISLAGIFTLYFIFRNDYFFDALFFSILAAITFPHVWVIVTMFKNKKSELN
ncbi:Brp/Blh family beta-carotene 15,15'-dioxygenase [Flavobacterium sp. UBA6135]|uniref:Brp/Blh family beta-carotene 15,15'-dioxygenase n=1 Tax=Flavobacterium sp. UBA6135 TaxID=1946553 RepID=UPI0025BB7056|nr:Brp/Blh family beta-carotene 15,15'-dioxygenase [Flavobacterium sp. UBA6135]